MTTPPSTKPAKGQQKSATLPGVLAAVDVVLAVLANRFFDSAVWVVLVVVLGAAFVLLTIFSVRSENGDRILTRAQIRKIVAGRIFVAVAAAIVAAALTFTVMHYLDNNDPGTAQPSPPGSSAPSTTATEPAACDLKVGDAGVIPVRAQAGAPNGLTFCPALLNNGAPITGPFTVSGRFIGPADRYRDLVIVNQADPQTCDALGNKPAPGFYYARTMTIDADGTWSFRDSLGYEEAVTIARDYQIISAPPAAIAEIKNDRSKFAKNHGGSDDEYAGMESLPAAARIVATFRQPPGKYKGTGSPCKNT